MSEGPSVSMKNARTRARIMTAKKLVTEEIDAVRMPPKSSVMFVEVFSTN